MRADVAQPFLLAARGVLEQELGGEVGRGKVRVERGEFAAGEVTTAARAFGSAYFNLLRRTAEGSLVLSTDHWRLDALTSDAFRFVAREQGAPDLVVRLDAVQRLTWDRLPKQQVRSQIRFFLANGDLWTFSGTVDESALPVD